MFKGFKDFLMRDDVITVAIGLVVALAFSNLVQAFTDSVITPLVAAAQPDSALGFGYQLGDSDATFINLGALVSALIYFVVFMLVVYFAIVVPYKHVQSRRGVSVFGDEAPTKSCPECLSDDLPEAARKCKHCGSLQATV